MRNDAAMFDAIVDDPSVHRATRAHFRAARQLGAGAVLGIDIIHKDVELHDQAWLYEAQGYLNHPKGAITLATRCTGVGPQSECIYHRSRLPGCIPCDIGTAQVPRTLSLFEHLNGTHWDGCNYGGWLRGWPRGTRHSIPTSRTLPAPSAPRQGSWR